MKYDTLCYEIIMAASTGILFQPFTSGPLRLANRIVMAPMTRAFSPGGIPTVQVAEYYARRAAAGVGLIITEGSWIDHPSASNDASVPNFHGEAALAGWREVVRQVHAAGGKVAPQLWHVGLTRKPQLENLYAEVTEDLAPKLSPSGFVMPGEKVKEESDENDILAAIDAYGRAAGAARDLGFDAIEILGAHGYLIDQFFWNETNHRTDRWGGRTLAERARFGAEAVRACRDRTSPDFPIIFRFSQWKLQDYSARLAYTPAELEAFLQVLSDAGVDIFHASQRRFFEPAFEGSPLNLAGWAKKLTGKPSISVGSVGISRDLLETFATDDAVGSANYDDLVRRMESQEFDLIAIGRMLISNPDWTEKVRAGDFDKLEPYSVQALAELN